MASFFPRLDIVRNSETKQFYWRFYSTNGLELARASETHSRCGAAVRSAAKTLGLQRVPTQDGVVGRVGRTDDDLFTVDNAVNVRFQLRPVASKPRRRR